MLIVIAVEIALFGICILAGLVDITNILIETQQEEQDE